MSCESQGERTTGTVKTLRRYPVKSMLGEDLEAANVFERGVLGDRSYALVDRADGKVASAKNPRKWSRLFEFEAALSPAAAKDDAAPVWITFPDGNVVSSEREDVDHLLSAEIGAEVSLRSVDFEETSVYEHGEPGAEEASCEGSVSDEALVERTFFDAAVIHVITTATLDYLAELYPRRDFDERRFRPNAVLKVDGVEGIVEDEWPGRILSLGDEVKLEILGPCPRCVMVTLPQGDLPKDSGILRAPIQHNGGNAGVYAAVLRGGCVRVGDRISLE